MSQRIYIFANGILNFPRSSHGWTDRAVIWCEQRGLLAGKFEYFCPALTRRIWQGWNTEKLVDKLAEHRDRPITLVAHSNGCELVCRAMRRAIVEGVRIHFLSPATDASFDRNGLNQAMSDGRVESAAIHWGGRDRAMWFAWLSLKAFGWLGLGYGTLGLTGPKNVSPEHSQRVLSHCEPSFGHSSWFAALWFEQTMRAVTYDPTCATHLASR